MSGNGDADPQTLIHVSMYLLVLLDNITVPTKTLSSTGMCNELTTESGDNMGCFHQAPNVYHFPHDCFSFPSPLSHPVVLPTTHTPLHPIINLLISLSFPTPPHTQYLPLSH